MNLFQACVALNYHFRCFSETHIIVLKKSKKKLHERQNVQIDRFFKHFRQSSEVNDRATYQRFNENS
jgi:hypothetical protein